jgi:integrase
MIKRCDSILCLMRLPPKNPLPKYLTQDELKRFFAVIESPCDKALFGLIYHYGLRVGKRSCSR